MTHLNRRLTSQIMAYQTILKTNVATLNMYEKKLIISCQYL